MALSDSLKDYSLQELIKLSKIPSISFGGFERQNVFDSADAVEALLKDTGYQNVRQLQIEECFPYVVGEYLVDPKLPTVLLYAHHDVQPPLREELWKTPPFEPTEKAGRLYGRGTADDKAGVLVHAAALKYYLEKDGKPPVNLKVLIEGEEEIGSPHLLRFLSEHREELKTDVIVVTDTANINSGVPSVTVSLRGIAVVDVAVRSLKASLHSGLWGGGVTDPVNALTKMLAQLTDDEGEILLPSTKGYRKTEITNIPLTREEIFEQSGAVSEDGVPEDFLDRMWNRPAFSINAIQASSEKLANNVICDRAFARIGIRVPGDMSAQKVSDELVSRLKELSPQGVDVEIHAHHAADGWRTDPQSAVNKPWFDAAMKSLSQAYGRDAVFIGCGASIPFIQPFEKGLEAPVLSLGIEDPYTLAHSENESLLLSDFYKAIDAEILLFEELAKLKSV